MERDEARWGQRPSSAPLLTWYARRPGLPSNSEVFVIVGTETGAAVRLRAFIRLSQQLPPSHQTAGGEGGNDPVAPKEAEVQLGT